MNFTELLRNDEEPTRKLDAWISEHIRGVEEIQFDKKGEPWEVSQETMVPPLVRIPEYTTGRSIDPIWKLANEVGMTKIFPVMGGWKVEFAWVEDEDDLKNPNWHEPEVWHSVELAIANAVFIAYQEGTE